MLMLELRNLENKFPEFITKDSLTQHVGGNVKEGFEKVEHEVPLQSLLDIFNFDGAKYLYKMPVAMKDIKAGDCVIHARKPMFVTRVAENSLFAVDPVDGENKEIMLAKSPFGFNFCTKVVNLFENFVKRYSSFSPSSYVILIKLEDT